DVTGPAYIRETDLLAGEYRDEAPPGLHLPIPIGHSSRPRPRPRGDLLARVICGGGLRNRGKKNSQGPRRISTSIRTNFQAYHCRMLVNRPSVSSRSGAGHTRELEALQSSALRFTTGALLLTALAVQVAFTPLAARSLASS